MSEYEIVNGAEIDAAIESAKQALEKDASSPREVTVTVKLHKHEEYPKTLYRGKETKAVADADSEAAAAKEGFGPYDHAAFIAVEKEA